MSAICGIFNIDGKAVQQKELEVMMKALSHRGLDGSDIIINGSIGFGHQMFHVWENDHHEKLPFYDQEKKLMITADARLDNREELIEALGISSEQKDIPNSILILKAYEKWKENLADHLIGDFMIVIWDDHLKQLIFVSDFLGNRALFYHKNANQLIFATEIKAITALDSVPNKLNKEFLALSIAVTAASLYDPESTYFEGIQSMTSRTVMIVNSQNTRTLMYGKLDIHKELNLKNEEEWIEQFQSLFFKVMHSLSNSRFPIVSLLSGGLDSSSVTAVAAKILEEKNQKLHALSAVLPENYKGSIEDESYFIDQMKVFDNIQFHKISDPSMGPFDDLETQVKNAERFGMTSRHFLYSAFAKKSSELGSRMMMEGVMGEIGPSFHSQGCFAELLYRGKWIRFMNELMKYAQLHKKSLIHTIRYRIIHIFMPIRIQTRNLTDLNLNDLNFPVQKDFLNFLSSEKLLELNNKNILSHAVYPNHRKNQVNFLLERGRSGPRNGFTGYEHVKICSPFSDRRIIEFCLASPIWMKLNNGYSRYMIRAGMKDILPEKIRLRTTKKPFSVDYHERFNCGIKKATNVLNNIKNDDPINEIIDVKKAKSYLNIKMKSKDRNAKDNLIGLHVLPNVIQLCYFLRRFEEFQK